MGRFRTSSCLCACFPRVLFWPVCLGASRVHSQLQSLELEVTSSAVITTVKRQCAPEFMKANDPAFFALSKRLEIFLIKPEVFVSFRGSATLSFFLHRTVNAFHATGI